MKNLCVYCGSNPGNRPDYIEQARALARLIKRDIGLVYGGSVVGIMGEVANEVLAGGGRVIGVIPELLLKKEHAHRGLTELHLVQTMHERKAMMIDKADGFIAPARRRRHAGGVLRGLDLGPAEHAREALRPAQRGRLLRRHAPVPGPCRGRILHPPQHRDMLVVEQDPVALLDRYAAYRAPVVSKWFEPVKAA